MMYTKMDVVRITERRDGAVYKTKKVAYHWFQTGKCPEPNQSVSAELITQNGLSPGEYVYCSTMDYIIESRCPAGGLYK